MQHRASHINRPLGPQAELLQARSIGNASTDNLSACSAITEEDEESGPNMAVYKSTYHEDSDADDEFERSVFVSPTLPQDFSPTYTDDMTSPEHTPTTFAHSQSGGSYASPTSLITQWNAEQCADFLSSLGLGQYADAIKSRQYL